MSLFGKLKSAWNKNVKPLGQKIDSAFDGLKKAKPKDAFKLTKSLFKKLKLKNVLDNDLVDGALAFVPGGGLLKKGAGLLSGLGGMFKGAKNLLPQELKEMKPKDLLDTEYTMADKILEKVTGRSVRGASARGRSTVRVSSRSSRTGGVPAGGRP